MAVHGQGSEADQSAVCDPSQNVIEDQRPWGGFRQYTANEPTTVLLAVDAGQSLSLQRAFGDCEEADLERLEDRDGRN